MERMYVRVEAVCSLDGAVCPKAVVWEETHVEKIDKVRFIGLKNNSSGPSALLYRSLMSGVWRDLFLEVRYDHKSLLLKWFMEP